MHFSTRAGKVWRQVELRRHNSPFDGVLAMKRKSRMFFLSVLLPASIAISGIPTTAYAQESAASTPEVVKLWPGKAPGTESWSGEERSMPFPSPLGNVTFLTNITVPTLTVVRPRSGQANGTAMVVVPGGGFRILAWDHEGLEVARWLADRGVTAFVLKYRVRTDDEETRKMLAPAGNASFDDRLKEAAPMLALARADALQAMRYVRSHARSYSVEPNRIGMIGFSAGAMTTLSVVQRADAQARPDFAAPIYGAMEPLAVPADSPPLFLVHTQGDKQVPSGQSFKTFEAWTAVGRPAELHIYQKGEHGFGMRTTGNPVDKWTEAFEIWLRSNKLLERN
jgi:acetyl esterase/lipase